ncbi:MAG: protein kinase, partial [Pirellulaceae bacterium]
MTKKLGPYRLERLLGRGGMGSVFAGVHEETGERAAIKSLSVGLADDLNFRSRFQGEIETLKQLRHSNIVRILGEGEQDGQLFYAMELVDGKSLQELLQAGYEFSWQEVLRIGIDICGALKHAHDCGVIHRDLKPANLLRTADGTVKLTDFGIAKLFGASHQTAAGSVVGTADYMSPEQSDGRPVTHRTDLYSLGAVLFTLLARRSPFQGGTLAQVVHKLKYEEAPSVRRFAPQVPVELDALVSELLRKDASQRPATALALANRLRAMEHVLTAREPNLPADAPTSESPMGEIDAPTAMVPPEAATKLGPTSLDNENAVLGQFSWNEATVETSPTRPPTAQPTVKPSHRPTVQNPNGGTPSAVPEVPATGSRFTTIDEQTRRRSERRLSGDEEPAGQGWAGAVGIAATLLVIIALCIWGLWPPSADSLYDRIQTTIGDQGADYAWKDI